MKATEHTIYGDEPFDVVAVVSHPEGKVAVMTKFLPSRNGILNQVVDNVFDAIKKDHRKLFWTAKADDENRAWHFERADGSFTRAGMSLFWYGVQNVKEVEDIIEGFEKDGRIDRVALPVAPSKPPHRGGAPAGARAFSTSARRMMGQQGKRGYATEAFVPSTEKKTVALIGARGYTGQNLISLIDAHPYLSLTHVSSRQLEGTVLPGYSKSELKYCNLSPADVKKMAEENVVDAWVMALPNGVCKPFVDAVDAAVPAGGKGLIVDLSADYRFEEGWTYGLPELYDRALTRQSKRISNPGCYASNTQLLVAPLLPYLDAANPPSIFGVSGYSGAGTKTSDEKDEAGHPITVAKVTPEDLRNAIRPYALTDHIHEKEASFRLSSLLPEGSTPIQLAFVPNVASWFSGIISVMSAPLTKTFRASEIKALYEEKYGKEPLAIIQAGVPDVKDAEGKHGWRVGGFQVHSSGKRVVVVGALDNLLKGASTVAMTNLNLGLGYDEWAGIPKDKI